MVHSIHLLSSITFLVHISVKLPNGDIVQVTHIGTDKLSSTLTLDNVLCVPTFSINLVSISKLTQNIHWCCLFLSNFCLIQDLQLWRMIGLGKKLGGVYILQNSSIALPASIPAILSKLVPTSFKVSVHSCNKISIVDDSNLWHYRLGHPSSQRMHLLQNCVSLISCCNKTSSSCTVCPIDKQRRLPFTHISKSSFDLVHVDIWGPYSVPSLNGSKYLLTNMDNYNKCTWVYLMKSKFDTS